MSYVVIIPNIVIHVILNYTTEVLANQSGGTILDDGSTSILLLEYQKVLIDIVGVMMSTVPPPTLREVLNLLISNEDTWLVRIQFEPHPNSSMQKMWDTVECPQHVPEEHLWEEYLSREISSMVLPQNAIYKWNNGIWPTAMIRKKLVFVFFHDYKGFRSWNPSFMSWCPLSQFLEQQNDEIFSHQQF